MFYRKFFVFGCLFVLSLFNQSLAETSDNFKSADEILAEIHNEHATDCASAIFADALTNASHVISEDTPEMYARNWAKQIMQSPNVLKQILECPEVKNIPETQTVIFNPVIYKFPNGRTLTINYTSQPKTLKQHILLATRPSKPADSVSPDLSKATIYDKYMNTEPAWYAIMVVQHDSLSEFVGPNKNNTISVKYIDDHINQIYPKGFFCTSKSALTPDNDTINQATKLTVDLGEKDDNDYYVAGNINLGWVMYAEIAADILLTVGTGGLGEAALIWTKGKNSARAARNIQKSLKTLRKEPVVKEYISITHRIAQHSDDIKKIKNATNKAVPLWDDYVKLVEKIDTEKDTIAKLYKEMEKITDTGKISDILDIIASKEAYVENTWKDAEKIMDKLGNVFDTVSDLDNGKLSAQIITDTAKAKAKIKEIEADMKLWEEAAASLYSENKIIQTYNANAKAASEILKYRRNLNTLKRPQTGNVITRALKSLRAAQKGSDKIAETSKLARAGMSTRSAKLKDWLFESTLTWGSRLARYERNLGMLYGAVSFLGEMYDYTSETSKEFSNGIEFKPLGLLSADNIKGSENVVNYGMWLMWEGNSVDPADDDAAYLQAMDFATKFAYNLNQVQSENGVNCNVDIYVVRPIIKLDETNTENPKGEMYYLFMNEIPWTTADQFSENITDVDKWNNEQEQMFALDPVKARGYKLESELTPQTQDEYANTDSQNITQNTEHEDISVQPTENVTPSTNSESTMLCLPDDTSTCCEKTDISCIRKNKLCKNKEFRTQNKDVCTIKKTTPIRIQL